MVSWLVGIAWLMHLLHMRCVHGLLLWLSMLALRTVCSLQLRVCRRGFSWPLLAVPSVAPPTWTLAASQPSNIHVTYAIYVDTGGRNHHLSLATHWQHLAAIWRVQLCTLVGCLVLRETSRGYVTTWSACLVDMRLPMLKKAAWKLMVCKGRVYQSSWHII